MPLEICPSLFNITPDKETKPYNENDIFRSDRFKILQAESLTRVKNIIDNIPTGQLQIRLLCCYRMKNSQETYCTLRKVDNPEKQICSENSGIQTSFIHFHIHGKKENLRGTEYMLAFIESSDLSINTSVLVEELLSSITWLELNVPEVSLNVFTFGEPLFGTQNISHSLEKIINSVKTQDLSKYQGTVYCRNIIHINKNCENCLVVSLKNGYLFFNPS